MFKLIVILLFWSLVDFSSLAVASYDYAVITTQQKAKDIMRQLKPLFGDNAQFSAQDYQLIIKASPTIIKEVKYVLKQIDYPLNNLIISIANYRAIAGDNNLTNSTNYSNIQTHKNSTAGSVKITATQRQSDKQQDKIYSARVIEGNWVYLYISKQVPYYSYEQKLMFDSNNHPNKMPKENNYNYPAMPQTQYKEISSGFDAKAILIDNQHVIVEIRAQSEQQNKTYKKNINTSSANTTISGNLNQWIEISHMSHANQEKTGVNYNNRKNQQEMYYIKVERLDL